MARYDRRGVRDFRDLQVWQKAHQLTLAVYRHTDRFPGDERYGLSAQLRRSSASIAANLAEGCGRNGDAKLARFCSIAMGSASELDCQLLLARDLKLLNATDYADLAGHVRGETNAHKIVERWRGRPLSRKRRRRSGRG